MSIELEELPYGSNKKLENMLIFKMVWENLFYAYESEVKHIAIQRWLQTKESAMDSLIYAIECVTNRIINEEQNKRIDEC